MPTRNNKESVRESTNIVNPFIIKEVVPNKTKKVTKKQPVRAPELKENYRVSDRIKESKGDVAELRNEEAQKYTIPYIPEKEIRLTTGRYNTGKISTNILDSIYNAAIRTGVPVDIALGLAGRESTLGIGRGFKRGQPVTGTDLMSNWQQIDPYTIKNSVIKGYNDVAKKYNNNAPLTKEEADKMIKFFEENDKAINYLRTMNENPIDNALKYYMAGKYNPGDKRHTQMVEEDAKVLMSDPAIQKWYQSKINTQMKCGGRRKAQLGLDIREGGIAIPIAPNMYYMNGRSHDDGGIAIGPNNKNGLEVEGGEVVKVGNKDIKVFSSVPLLRGVSPAQLVMGGANPNKVFKAQEDFKDRNRINDDGTTYENGGEKIYTPSKAIQRQLQETGKVTIGGAPTIGGLRTYSYLRGLANARKYGTTATNIFRAGKELIKRGTEKLVESGKISRNVAQIPRSIYAQFVGVNGQNLPKTISLFKDDNEEYKMGGLNRSEDYGSKKKPYPSVSKSDFAGSHRSYPIPTKADAVDALRLAGLHGRSDVKAKVYRKYPELRKKKEFGGSMLYTINGNVKNGLMSFRPKAELGTEKKINNDTKIGEDGLIYTRGIDGNWYTDGTRYEDSKYYMGRKSAQQYSRKKIKSVPKTQTLDEVVVTAERPKSKEEKKIVTTQGADDKITTETIEGVQVDYPENKSSYKPFTYKKDKDGNLVKVYSNTDTRMNNAYVSPDREGANYKPKSYNPLTGETVNEDGVVETSTPSVSGTTKVSQSSTPRGRGTSSTPASKGTAKVESPKPATATNPMEARYASRIQKGTAQEPVKTEKAVTEATITPDQVRYTRAAGFQGGKSPSSTRGQTGEKLKNDTEGRWIGQYKTTTPGDWIGLGANILGSIGSYFITKSAIDKLPKPVRPALYQAAKLKTKYNINPQLTEVGESEQTNRATVRRNTQSSKTSIAREQRLLNEARTAKNVLYGQKENIETQLINQDKLNRQQVAAKNVAAYNDYLNRIYANKVTQNQAKVSNVNNLISGLTGGVNSILGSIESRRMTNNTLRAIAAANPNVDARLIGGFDYYIDPVSKKKYNKNQQYVGTING